MGKEENDWISDRSAYTAPTILFSLIYFFLKTICCELGLSRVVLLDNNQALIDREESVSVYSFVSGTIAFD